MSSFQEGYKFFSKSAGAVGASVQGDNYVRSVEEEISKFAQAMAKELSGKHTEIDKAKGFAAEQWHAGTFNVNAALRGSSNRVQVVDSIRGQLGSPDIVGAAGDAGLKYYRTAKESAEQQAMSLFERYQKYAANARREGRTPAPYEEYKQKLSAMGDHDPLYGGQVRIIPKEQLKQAEAYLKRRISEEQGKRPELVEKYKDTLKLLQDRLSDHDGNESIPLSNADAEEIAKVAEVGKFDPKEFGISTKDLMNWEYIRTQSFQAGFSAAAITIALKTAPEIMIIIQQLIENGEVDSEQMKKTGRIVLSSGAEGFIRGMLASALTIACKSGLWGEALTAVSPAVMGGIVVFAMDAMKCSISVLIGKKDVKGFQHEIAEEAFSAIGAVTVGGTLSAVIPIPGLGYMIGSLIGSMMGSYVYRFATNTTAVDKIVADFQQQAKMLAQYAAELFQIDLDAFQKNVDTYSSIMDRVCEASDEKELNRALHSSYEILGISLPWKGEFSTFMKDKSQCLVFE